ncbi:MAG: O-antigen ligase family protein [Thermoleophilia bacterium]
MNILNKNSLDSSNSRVEIAAVILLSVIVSVVVLYPEEFISGGIPVITSARFLPSNFMAFIIATGAGILIYARFRIFKPGPLDIAVLVFFAYLAIRSSVTPSALHAIRYSAFGFATFYLVTGIRARSYPSAMNLIWVLTALTAVTAAYGCIEYLAQTNFIFHPLIKENVLEPLEGVHRIGSTLAHPVSYAGYLVQSAPFCVLAFVKARSRNGRIFAASTCIVAVLALFLTYSKGSWIVALLMVVAGAMVIFNGQRRKVLVTLGITLVVSAGLAGVFWQQIRLENSVRSDISVENRLASWRGAVAGIQAHPLWGVGLDQGQWELSVRVDPEWVEALHGQIAVDNYYLNILLEEGVVGALLWLIVLGLIFKEGISLIRRHGPGYAWGLAAMASIVAILLNCMTYDALLIRPHVVLFWIAAGLIHGTTLHQTPEGRIASDGVTTSSA